MKALIAIVCAGVMFIILPVLFILAVILLATTNLIAADIPDIGIVTEKEGIEIHRCHPTDLARVEVVHVTAKTNSFHGWFETDKPALYLSDLSMIPTGTNIFRVRTICSGSTSEVSEVKFTIRRPIPRPTFDKVDRFPPIPPSPWDAGKFKNFQDLLGQTIDRVTMPLPGGTNIDYSSQIRWFREQNRRRSQ